MKRKDHRPPTGGQSLRKGNGKGGLEVIELVIDGNSQGLKDAGCRMGLRSPACGGRQAESDGFNQIGTRPQRVASAAFDDGFCDRSAGGLFAVAEQEVRQVIFVDRGEQVGGRFSLRRVETHVERTGRLEAESPFTIGQLIGSKSQIEQDPIDAVDAKLVEDFGQLGITGLLQDNARIGQRGGRPCEHLRIAIQTDQFSVGTELFEDEATVTAGSDGAVNHDQPRRQVEELNDFPHKDGTVDGRAPIGCGPRRFRHVNRR
jgi:hypothetical protein